MNACMHCNHFNIRMQSACTLLANAFVEMTLNPILASWLIWQNSPKIPVQSAAAQKIQ